MNMKKLLPLVILILAATTFAQQSVSELQAKAKSSKLKDLIVSYDKFKDRSIVATKPQNLIGSWEGGMAIFATGMAGPNKAQTMLMLSIGYEFKGDKLTATPENYAIIFTSNSSDWNFLKGDKNFYILFDESRLELSPLGQDSDILWSRIGGPMSVSVKETLGFGISRADLERILAAKKIEFKLGDTKPREWKADWSKRIQAMLTLTKIEAN